MEHKDILLAVSGLLGGGSGGGGSAPLITLQPADAAGALGDTVTFHVEAQGESLTYLWQSNTTGSWGNTSFATSTADTLSVTVTEARNGKQFRCVVTSGGQSTVSNPATLRVAGQTAVLTAKTITANGTYAAADDSADGYSSVTVNVASGLKLLASGTYTHGGTTYLTIPVSYTGTAKYVFVCVDEPKDSTAQCLAAVRCLGSPFSEINAEFQQYMVAGSVAGYASYYGLNASNAAGGGGITANSGNLGQWTVSASQISFNKVSNTYPWAANTYHWYIYGEEASA